MLWKSSETEETMNIDGFIDQVRNRPALWNPTSPEYTDRKLKNREWLQICRSMGIDVTHMNDLDKERAIRELKLKWKNLRDAFVRHIRTHQRSTRRVKPYVYAKQMNFLRRVLDIQSVIMTLHPATQEGASSSQSKKEDSMTFKVEEIFIEDSSNITDHGESFQQDLGCGTFLKDPISVQNGEPSPKTSLQQEIQMTSLEEFANSGSFNNTSHSEGCSTSRTQLVLQEQQTVHSQPSTTNFEEDDDMAFFRSLIPTLRLLPPEKKLQFRIGVMQSLATYIR